MKASSKTIRGTLFQLKARLRRPLTPAERAPYDERVLAIRTILELTKHRQERRITQRSIAQRMGVSQPVIA